MTEHRSIDDLLDEGGQPSAETPQDIPAAVVEATPSASPETPPEPQAPKGEEGAPPAPAEKPSDDPKVRAFQRKAEDETRKRQEFERNYATLQQQAAQRDAEYRQLLAHVQQQQRPAQQPNPAQPNPAQFLDPEAVAYAQSMVQQSNQQMQEAMYRQRVEMSQEMMRAAAPDYDEIEEYFALAADQNPTLRAQLRNHPNPARAAYEIGKHAKVIMELGNDPAGWQAAERERIRQEVMAEMQPQQPTVQAPNARPSAPPPKSLAGISSASPRNPAQSKWDGPLPLDELLK